MPKSPFLKNLLITSGVVAALIVAVILMLFMRQRMQQQSGLYNTPAPTSVSNATAGQPGAIQPTGSAAPTVKPTSFIDPATVAGGDRGLLVAAVQARLYALGYYAYKPTGYFAVLTQNAVRSFQLANHLIVDGVVSKGHAGSLVFKRGRLCRGDTCAKSFANASRGTAARLR